MTTENTEMKTEHANIKTQLLDTPQGPRIDYSLYGEENFVMTSKIPLEQINRILLGRTDPVIICSIITTGNNIEDVCLMNNTYKKDEAEKLLKYAVQEE